MPAASILVTFSNPRADASHENHFSKVSLQLMCKQCHFGNQSCRSHEIISFKQASFPAKCRLDPLPTLCFGPSRYNTLGPSTDPPDSTDACPYILHTIVLEKDQSAMHESYPFLMVLASGCYVLKKLTSNFRSSS